MNHVCIITLACAPLLLMAAAEATEKMLNLLPAMGSGIRPLAERQT